MLPCEPATGNINLILSTKTVNIMISVTKRVQSSSQDPDPNPHQRCCISPYEQDGERRDNRLEREPTFDQEDYREALHEQLLQDCSELPTCLLDIVVHELVGDWNQCVECKNACPDSQMRLAPQDKFCIDCGEVCKDCQHMVPTVCTFQCERCNAPVCDLSFQRTQRSCGHSRRLCCIQLCHECWCKGVEECDTCMKCHKKVCKGHIQQRCESCPNVICIECEPTGCAGCMNEDTAEKENNDEDNRCNMICDSCALQAANDVICCEHCCQQTCAGHGEQCRACHDKTWCPDCEPSKCDHCDKTFCVDCLIECDKGDIFVCEECFNSDGLISE